jgi:hypothetical protein
LDKKITEKEVGPPFLTFFDTMKNEQARALPSFYHGPHSKQEDVSRILQILASVCNAPAAAVTTTPDTDLCVLFAVEKIKHQMTLGGIFEKSK